ncbi:TPR-like protein [Hortaea werneckii]|nr:TPR-like protein [Hortaea werneckii]KAI7089799.1 TPR-like protein [Hortaea werneckii]KAI7230289.1 TPR-like protein [Hortaea werneckii]KAI7289976.1 TPR-like protein [Hortaea werneckii]KAI7376340.1 TPR-like protein [Hortaea werneckii]
MSTKANLKAAKAALDAQDWDKVVIEAQIVLASDNQNFFARLFLGRALEKQEKYDEAEKTYQAAAKSKPEDSQPWLGLCSVYEAQGSKKLDEYREASVKAAEVFANVDDKHRCQTTIDKLTTFAKQNGSTAQYKRVLEVLLPGSPVYDCLEGRTPHASHTYMRLAEITEEEEAQRIKQQISERRTRIGARLGQVTTDVKREVIGNSNLETLYREVIKWSGDDEMRRQYEEKLLQRTYEHLTILPPERKGEKLDQVLDQAEGMVIIHHGFELAWNLVLETRDLGDLRDLDVNILREFVVFFQDSGLAKIVQGWLTSELSPFPLPEKKDDDSDEEMWNKNITPEDRLVLMTEGLAKAEESSFAHRLVADHYLHLEEHESAAETARAGMKAVSLASQRLGMSMQNTKDALNSTLATALVHVQAPRNHAEARRLFEDILQRKPRWTPALIGLGLILEEAEEYQNAVDYFTKALQEDEGNVHIGTELAWCRALCGNYEQARQELESYLPSLKMDNPRSRDLRAQVLYRIGQCIWELDTSKSARRSREGAYARFLSAIKTNVNFPPAYTSLGIYYTDYAKDKKRARQCFQKAFELSPAETYAAERLAKSFADQGDWDIVEVIAQRVVDSGRARPPPGSKRKGLSWPYSALGVVQMNRQDYQTAITSFLAALRIAPDDYQSYVGLGESYHNSGRYNSALRTFNHALQPPEGFAMRVSGETWFAKYMLANVHRELGDYDDAIQGLQEVLEERNNEFGVLMSLLQTFVEKAWRCLETGLYGQAADSAKQAINIAAQIVEQRPQAFNLWKALGDASMLFSWVQSANDDFPLQSINSLLATSGSDGVYDLLADVDRLQQGSVEANGDATKETLPATIKTGILAYKRAIFTSTHEIHAQAVAWYNLGWAEHRAFVCSDQKAGKRYLRAAVRCFKRAIELEAGNAEFWNALGVVTTVLNPKVAQHSFVRSLHLNELNAKVWANLGVLYMLQDDLKLAHQAFGKAQSTDPEYAHAWVGEGLIALLLGEAEESLNHFTHAFEISDSASTISKRQYTLSSFDHLLNAQHTSNDLTQLIQPVFALEQLRIQSPTDVPYRHLAALLQERIGSLSTAIETLADLCTLAETEYEQSESLTALGRFAQAKSDLARCQLATASFQLAAENATTALDLTSDATSPNDIGFTSPDSLTRLRLSSHLVAGLAQHNLQKGSPEAITMFRSALEESQSNPDVVCLLAQVLWAHGGKDEKSVAREQLLEAVEKHPEHIGCVTLLGAIAALDDDVETVEAIREDLLALRTKIDDGMNDTGISSLLSAFAGLSSSNDTNAEEIPVDPQILQAQTSSLLNPNSTHSWALLAKLTGEGYAAGMALQTAEKSVPPSSRKMEAEELARALAGVGTVGDAQRAVMFAPWERAGREAFVEALS